MDLSKYKQKLIGSNNERAVSPVIGVILMVAITVILAAVIATFVMGIGDDIGGEATAGVQFDTTNSDAEVEVSVTSMGNAEKVVFRGDADSDVELTQSGDTATFVLGEELTEQSGTITAVAVTDDETETSISSQEYDFSDAASLSYDSDADEITVSVPPNGEFDVSDGSETASDVSDGETISTDDGGDTGSGFSGEVTISDQNDNDYDTVDVGT